MKPPSYRIADLARRAGCDVIEIPGLVVIGTPPGGWEASAAAVDLDALLYRARNGDPGAMVITRSPEGFLTQVGRSSNTDSPPVGEWAGLMGSGNA